MKKIGLILALFVLSIFGVVGLKYLTNKPQKTTGAPPYLVEDLQPPNDPYSWIRDWERPSGPAKVGLQVGHWKNAELPEELARLKGNTGAQGGGKFEWEVNLRIAQLTGDILKDHGVEVDIFPSTVPIDYWADVFVAIHADGSTDYSKSGFKIATPRRDYTGKAKALQSYIELEYQNATKLVIDPNITRNMTGYYAFAWWRYDHAVHAMTASAILETGFLTNPSDRKVIVSQPQLSAFGLANGIIGFLQSEGLLDDKD